jgi:hypothetical protein
MLRTVASGLICPPWATPMSRAHRVSGAEVVNRHGLGGVAGVQGHAHPRFAQLPGLVDEQLLGLDRGAHPSGPVEDRQQAVAEV